MASVKLQLPLCELTPRGLFRQIFAKIVAFLKRKGQHIFDAAHGCLDPTSAFPYIGLRIIPGPLIPRPVVPPGVAPSPNAISLYNHRNKVFQAQQEHQKDLVLIYDELKSALIECLGMLAEHAAGLAGIEDVPIQEMLNYWSDTYGSLDNAAAAIITTDCKQKVPDGNLTLTFPAWRQYLLNQFQLLATDHEVTRNNQLVILNEMVNRGHPILKDALKAYRTQTALSESSRTFEAATAAMIPYINSEFELVPDQTSAYQVTAAPTTVAASTSANPDIDAIMKRLSALEAENKQLKAALRSNKISTSTSSTGDGLLYCFMHGYNKSHRGATCHLLKGDEPHLIAQRAAKAPCTINNQVGNDVRQRSHLTNPK